jgi:hypothetical protein
MQLKSIDPHLYNFEDNQIFSNELIEFNESYTLSLQCLISQESFESFNIDKCLASPFSNNTMQWIVAHPVFA